MKRALLLALIATFTTNVLAQTNSIRYEVRNTSDIDRTDIPVVIKLDSEDTSDIHSAIVTLGTNKEIPCQLDDLDQDDTFDELCFLADLKAKATRQYHD